MATTPGYDPKKAALFNQLRQRGLDEDTAAAQAGITDAESENYAIGMNGQLGSFVDGFPASGKLVDKGQFTNVDYDVKADAPVSSKTPITYTTTSTTEVSGGGSTTIIDNAPKSTAASQALQPAINSKQAEIDQFNRDNPTNFVRKKQGLPPLTPEENQKRSEQALALAQQKQALTEQQDSAKESVPPTIITTPNTTTTTTTVTTGTAAVNAPVQAPEGPDPVANRQAEVALGVSSGPPISTPGLVDEFTNIDEQIALEAILREPPVLTPEEVDAEIYRATIDVDAEIAAAAADARFEPDPIGAEDTQSLPNGLPYDDDGNLNPGWSLDEDNNPVYVGGNFVEPATQASADASRAAATTAAARSRAQVQATLANQKRQADQGDWRLKLRLAPGARYLYRGEDGQGVGAGILAPLAVTDGVVFPYTPQVSTNYNARYSETDLPHSNYRGYFYNNSYVDGVNIEAIFTAQDTFEANYLLAVIHFFRSVTKMFYGQDDAYRGAPPPLVFLQGFGTYQFSRHPCVVTSFRYTLPQDVDYIRADVAPITGLNIQQRRSPGGVPPQSLPTNVFTGALARLAAAGVPKGAVNRGAPTDTLGTNSPTYVPTKMTMTIELLPMQTRQQVSQEFNMRDFASGALIKKGFW